MSWVSTFESMTKLPLPNAVLVGLYSAQLLKLMLVEHRTGRGPFQPIGSSSMQFMSVS